MNLLLRHYLLIALSGIMLALFMSAAAFAQEQSTSRKSTAEAEQFFADCTSRPIIPSTEEATMAFCACAATKVQEWNAEPAMSSGPLNVLQSKELDKDTLLSKIYGPCLYIPVFDISYDECYESKQKRFFHENQDLLEGNCNCVAKGDSEYFQRFAQPYLELLVSQKKNFDDPIKEVRNDSSFYSAHYDLETECHQRFVGK